MELLIKFVLVASWCVYVLYTIIDSILKWVKSRKRKHVHKDYSISFVLKESSFTYNMLNKLSSKEVLEDLMNLYGTWSNTLIVHDDMKPEFVELRRKEGSVYKNKTWGSVENYLKGQIKKGSKIVVLSEVHDIKIEFYKL